MENNPVVSVVVPVFNANRGSFLRRQIEAILGQNYRNIELILVNDGSTDDSLIVCQEYAKKDPRIVLLTQENQGASAARNAGIKIAHGDYIHICDADDFVEPEIYSESMRLADLMKPDVLRFNLRVVRENGFDRSIIINQPYNTLLDRQYIIDEVIPYTIGIKNDPQKRIESHCTLITKRDLLTENNIYYNERHNKEEDHPFLVNILAYAQSIVFLKGTYYHYLKHSNSLISEYSPRFRCICENFSYYEQLFGTCYDFESQEKTEYNINILVDCLDYVIIHHKSCNSKEETIKILKSNEAHSWFSILDPKTAFLKQLKRCVLSQQYDMAYIYCVWHYYELRGSNLVKKLKRKAFKGRPIKN